MPREKRDSVFDDFTEKSEYWSYRVDNYAGFEQDASILRMWMGPTEALYYSNAELSDGLFDDLPWFRKTFEARIRMSRARHVYRVEWKERVVDFFIDGVKVASLPNAGYESNARADIWIDNAVFGFNRRDAGQVYRHLTQENRSRTYLEVDYVKVY